MYEVMKELKVAAIQMQAVLADVDENLRKAEVLIHEAANQGAKWIILPEFFTSACAFHPNMLDAIIPIEGKATTLLKQLSKQLDVVIGGSFLALHKQDVYNTFTLVFPNGDVYLHSKDIPTMWENCYYIGGNDDGVLNTEVCSVGVSLCWEMLRSQTARRLLGKVNFVVSGSCWWDLPEGIPSIFDSLRKQGLQLLQSTPITFAKLLGVPVIHAGHIGHFEGYAPPSEKKVYKSRYLGGSQIINGEGQVLASMNNDDREGVILAEIDIETLCKPSMQIPESFWIPKMPKAFISEWDKLNKHGQDYYRKYTYKYLQNS